MQSKPQVTQKVVQVLCFSLPTAVPAGENTRGAWLSATPSSASFKSVCHVTRWVRRQTWKARPQALQDRHRQINVNCSADR